jgi:hypothetical protein
MKRYYAGQVYSPAFLALVVCLSCMIFAATCFACGYQLAMDKVTTAECQFVGNDAFYLFIDGNIYEWTRE